MALGREHVEPAGGDDLGLGARDLGRDPAAHRVGIGLGVVGQSLQHAHLDIAAKLDVGAAPGHVGRDGDGAGLAGVGDDLRLLLVLARVEHVVRHARLLQEARQHL